MTNSDKDHQPTNACRVIQVSAITFFTCDMAAAVEFYQSLGFELQRGGRRAHFTTLAAGEAKVNLMIASAETGRGRGETGGRRWGRIIFEVSNVDELYRKAMAAGLRADSIPANASWGERYFHLSDPDGNQISFASPL